MDRVRKFERVTWTSMNGRAANGKYRVQSRLTKHYDNILIKMTRDEYRVWCESMRERIESMTRPSIDRLDKYRHYSLDNIQVLELSENIRKDKTVFKDGVGRCSVCRESKPEDEFVRDKRTANGRSSMCKSCDNNRRRPSAK